MTKEEKEFMEWIRQQPCYFGGKVIEEKGFPYFCEQDWDEQKGEYLSEVSHIMRKGSTRRKEHIGNIFPNCRRHHRWFEMLTPKMRFDYLSIGKEYEEQFRNKLDSKQWWEKVRNLQR